MQPNASWIAGPRCAARDEGLHETVARIAAERPTAVALMAGRRTMTYAGLDGVSDAWAARLVAGGVVRGDRVPILLPRSMDLVIALLAVLKAGAAYALLDPGWPPRRLRGLVERLAGPLAVTREEPALGLTSPVWSPPTGGIAATPGFRPVRVHGSDPCCVFFTSGTTGEPKGVVSPHRATARLFQRDGFARFEAGMVMPLAAPVPWDAFSLELWSMLLTGGTCLIVDEPYLSAQSLRSAVTTGGSDAVWLTASLFNMIVDEAVDAFIGLRQVMIGGERLSSPHVGRFLRHHPGVVLLNGYGPVESTVFATTHPVTEADCARPGGIPIGRPVPGTRIDVLDGARPCEVGEIGEICVSGDGLALGYLGDDELTAAKFTRLRIDGEFRRIYRTGDLGMWDVQGLLHYRGRSDRQLKIRGHRVEPADVERQVEGLLPAVRDCRVIPRHDDSGAPRDLVAFCVPAEQGDPLTGALPVLRAELVPYQRPVAVVSVSSFPVTERGKLDERALLAMAPAAEVAEATTEVVHVRTAGTEMMGDADEETLIRLVTEVFGDVLGCADVPADVPFVELGGDSLGAGRVSARLAARLQCQVSVAWLYEHPTAAALARRLLATTRRTARAAEQDAEASVPLTPAQTLYLTRQLVDPDDRTVNCLLTWLVDGAPDQEALETAIAEVHARHEPLRAVYVPDPSPTAWPVDVPAPELAVLPGRPDLEAAAAALRTELAQHLEPREGDVWRAALVPIGDGSATLFGCAVHHIAFDGWSESVLAGDLSAAYDRALGQGAPSAPAPPPMATAYREYADRLAQEDLTDHHDRLRRELGGVPPLRWPPDPTDPASADPRHIEVPLSPAVVASVDSLAGAAKVTRFVALLALYGAGLAEVTKQDAFAVGVPLGQRHSRILERAIGCHITMLCVRLHGEALEGGAEAVAATGRAVAGALAAQDVPFADLLRFADPAPAGRPPLYQTLFALQDNAVPRLELGGLPTTFLRQHYRDLPLELHAELWPDEHGGLRLVISYRPEAVPESAAREVAERFADRLRTAVAPGGRRQRPERARGFFPGL